MKTELTLTPFEHELDVCRAAALRAGEIALRYRERGIGYDNKSDESPVTAADKECEQLFARAFEEAFPDDGLLGKKARRSRRAADEDGSSIQSTEHETMYAASPCG